jgi:Domain of unknown function (DU1801)
VATSSAKTPEEYLESLPAERRRVVSEVRNVIRANLPDGYEEGMQYGMIGWYVPLERFGTTYNGRPLGLAGLASQKQYISLYLNNVYSDPEVEKWFRERWAATGKKLQMGKSCVRFRRLEDVPLDVIGQTIARSELDAFVARHSATLGSARKTRAAASG